METYPSELESFFSIRRESFCHASLYNWEQRPKGTYMYMYKCQENHNVISGRKYSSTRFFDVQ